MTVLVKLLAAFKNVESLGLSAWTLGPFSEVDHEVYVGNELLICLVK